MIYSFNFVNAQEEISVEPQGVYKEIEIAHDNEILKVLVGNDKKLIKKTADSVLQNPNSHNPTIIYALSGVLFKQGKKSEASFWFYVGQLRARYDANLCLDISAREAVSRLTEIFGPEINKFAFQNIDSLKKTIIKVVDFVKNNNENYDHRWINLHGMGAIINDGSATTEPQEKWLAIKQKTVDDYYKGFMDYLNSVKK